MGRLESKEVISALKPDQRILTHVPDPTFKRKMIDRRGKKGDSKPSYLAGERYVIECPVEMKNQRKQKLIGCSRDISDSGMLVYVKEEEQSWFQVGDQVQLVFKIPSGLMKEGYDHQIKIKASMVRFHTDHQLAFCFDQPLNEYFSKRHWKLDSTIACFAILSIITIISLMRLELMPYVIFEPLIYGYSIMTAIYLMTRYVFGVCYKSVPINPQYNPGVSIIIPCFNEEQWIRRTLLSCLNQCYPIEKLEVILVDDCSRDHSLKKVNELIDELYQQYDIYDIKNRVQIVKLEQNSGKRWALVKGVELAKHELVTFVDSDSFLDPYAIINLVQPFQDSKVGGVTGRTDVENSYTNYITKMQSVRYYIAFRILKAAESIFDAVSCLSGPISCYRRALVEQHQEAWLNQTFLGYQATFGDDRSMTNFILKNHRTVYQDSAFCKTIVPSQFKVFVKQQMRWKRSWLRESLRAGSYMWRKEPFQAISFYMGFIVPMLAPIVFLYNLIYIPMRYHVFPTVFVMGLLLMSFLMSFAYLFFRKSGLWIYGLWFCLFYECILLWQMPIACLTFWKSTWGTRETKEDMAKLQRKQENVLFKAFKKLVR